MVLMFISCESKDDVNVGFSEKYLVGNMSGGSSFNNDALKVHNTIRGLYPFPTGYVMFDGEVLKICSSRLGENVSGEIGQITNIYKDGFGVKCADKEIIITKVKPSGKKEMLAKDFINGKRDLLGKILC